MGTLEQPILEPELTPGAVPKPEVSSDSQQKETDEERFARYQKQDKEREQKLYNNALRNATELGAQLPELLRLVQASPGLVSRQRLESLSSQLVMLKREVYK